MNAGIGVWLRHLGDRRHELVTVAGNGDQQLVARLGTEKRFAQEEDLLVEIFLFHNEIGPDRVHQLLWGDDALRPENQEGEQLKGLGTNRDGAPRPLE